MTTAAILATAPRGPDYPNEIDYARAMQRWAVRDVPASNPQRLICCVNDWFAEEMLILEEIGR